MTDAQLKKVNQLELIGWEVTAVLNRGIRMKLYEERKDEIKLIGAIWITANGTIDEND